MQERIRVLIADDRPSSRNGLRALLGVQPEIEIAGEAADGREAVQLAEELQPDVVLMDVSMPVLDGLKATQLVKNRWPQIKVIVLTMYALPQADVAAAGADCFLVKGCQTEKLLRAITGDPGNPSKGPARQQESSQETAKESGVSLGEAERNLVDQDIYREIGPGKEAVIEVEPGEHLLKISWVEIQQVEAFRPKGDSMEVLSLEPGEAAILYLQGGRSAPDGLLCIPPKLVLR